MGEALLINCDNQEEWDGFLEKYIKLVASFITYNSPSKELIKTIKGLAPEHKTAIKFLQVDVNKFKPKQRSFTVKEVPSVMFVMNTNRQFPEFSDLNAVKLKKKIKDFAGLRTIG